MKKNITVLVVTMLLNAANIFAQSGTTGPLEWILEDGVLTISGEGAMPDYDYPSYAPWFAYRESIHAVVMETGVTTIGDGAFPYCENLTSITVPNSVASVGYMSFYECKSLLSIIIPEGVTKIEEETFAYCESLTSVIIPNSVTTIGYRAFDYCENLTSATIPNNLIEIGSYAFQCCRRWTASIIFPNSLTWIGDDAFYGCESLTSITIPNSVDFIGWFAFSVCTSLTSINVESGNPYYASDDGVLFNKNKTALICCPAGKTGTYVVPKSVMWFGTDAGAYEAFRSCINLTSIEVENGNNYFASENGALFDKGKTNLICCPAGRTGDYVIPDCATNIEFYSFVGCIKLTSITIPNNITSMGERAFGECTNLTSITIPNSITKIENEVFMYCKGLTSITFPNTLKSIGDRAFTDCASLSLITNLNPVPPAVGFAAFHRVDVGACTLEVPIGSVLAYKNAYGWSGFNIVGIDAGIETIEPDIVKIYPNPTDGELWVECKDAINRVSTITITNIEIFDVFGRCVYIAHPSLREGLGGLDISNLPTGMYFVRITTENGAVTKKVVKR